MDIRDPINRNDPLPSNVPEQPVNEIRDIDSDHEKKHKGLLKKLKPDAYGEGLGVTLIRESAQGVARVWRWIRNETQHANNAALDRPVNDHLDGIQQAVSESDSKIMDEYLAEQQQLEGELRTDRAKDHAILTVSTTLSQLANRRFSTFFKSSSEPETPKEVPWMPKTPKTPKTPVSKRAETPENHH